MGFRHCKPPMFYPNCPAPRALSDVLLRMKSPCAACFHTCKGHSEDLKSINMSLFSQNLSCRVTSPTTAVVHCFWGRGEEKREEQSWLLDSPA